MDETKLRGVAAQLARPSGDEAETIAAAMNEANAAITARTIENLAPQAGETVAEIGPGNGALSIPIIKALGDSGRYLGIELSEEMAQAAATRLQAAGSTKIDIHNGDCRSAPVDAASLDALMAVNLLYFIDDLPELFGQVANWLKPDGRALFGIRSPESLNAMPFTQFGFRVRSQEEVETALREAGLTNITSSYHDEGTTMLGELEIPVDSIVIDARSR
ncbi:MAG: class I SAM-dependent methyltransferase [Alphaproteobacteria bacterium]|nr:class I SAM-dependent methyltransferase [Alphaproteobacteria bacterium]